MNINGITQITSCEISGNIILHAVSGGIVYQKVNADDWTVVDLTLKEPEVNPVNLIKPEKEYDRGSLKKAFIDGIRQSDNPYANNPYSPNTDEFSVWLEGRIYGIA